MDLNSFLVSLFFVTCLHVDIYSAISIDISPETFSKEKASSVDVSCRLDRTESDLREIMMMKITRKGERAIVMMYLNGSISYSAGNAEEFPASGDVSSKSLQITITTPDREDTGVYSCLVYYINNEGTLKNHKASSYLTVEDEDIKNLNSTVKQIVDELKQGLAKIKDVEKNVAETKSKVDNLDDKTKKQSQDIQTISDKESEVEKKLKDLADKTKNQIENLTDDLTKATQVNTKVSFLENTVLHQADTIRDLTQKLADFEKKLDGVKDDVDKRTEEKTESNIDYLNLKDTVSEHTKKITDVTDTADKAQANAKKLSDIAKVMAKKIDDNKNKVSEVERKLKDLTDDTKDKIDKLSKGDSGKDLSSLKDTVKENTHKITAVTNKANEASELAKKLKGVTDVMASKIEKNKELVTSSSSKSAVAFHVTSGVYSMYPVKSQPLIFNEISLNEGTSYNIKTGTFTAPRAGVYAFLLYLQIPCYGCRIEITIVADNKVISRFSGGSRYDYNQHSINAVTKLDRGGTVQARVMYLKKDQNNKSWSLGIMRKCAFSGFLVA